MSVYRQRQIKTLLSVCNMTFFADISTIIVSMSTILLFECQAFSTTSHCRVRCDACEPILLLVINNWFIKSMLTCLFFLTTDPLYIPICVQLSQVHYTSRADRSAPISSSSPLLPVLSLYNRIKTDH